MAAHWRLLLSFVLWILFIDYSIAGGSGPASFDCPMRDLILEYAQYIQPFLTKDKLQQIADALMGDPVNQNCTVSIDKLPYEPSTAKPTIHSPDIDTIPTIFICPNYGIDIIDSNDNQIHFGNINKPFKSIHFGLNYIRSHYNDKSQKKQILLRKGIHYLYETLYFNPNDSHLKISSYNGEDAIISGAIPLNNLNWKLYQKSKNNDGKDIYSAQISSDVNITEIVGLRVNGTRAIRCRYPNGNPEVYPPGFGSNLLAKSWYGAIEKAEPDYVYFPPTPQRLDNPEQLFENYNLGIGGQTCYNFEPPAGYRCSNSCQGGGHAPYMIPTGMVYNISDLPNAPYSDPKQGVVQAWRSGQFSSYI